MKVNKSLLAVLSMFLILLLFVSSASAADTNETSDVLSVDESVNLENNETSILSADNNDVESNANVLKESAGNYSGLAANITNAQESGIGQITLSKDCIYTYDSGNTINIHVNGFKVEGNGATIDMAGSISAFNITGKNVIINNLTIKNAKADNAGAIYVNNGASLNITNMNFYNNTATNRGGAIYSEGEVNIKNSLFDTNNITNRTKNVDNGGAAIYNRVL